MTFFILSPGHHLLIILIQAYQADEPITEEKQPAEFKEPFLNNSRLIVKKLAFLINHVT